jgi:hypothetical protein
LCYGYKKYNHYYNTTFLSYPLLSQKAADLILFKNVIYLINKGAHQYIEGLKQIVNIKAAMNLGIYDDLNSDFSKLTPVERPLILTENIPDPQ